LLKIPGDIHAVTLGTDASSGTIQERHIRWVLVALHQTRHVEHGDGRVVLPIGNEQVVVRSEHQATPDRCQMLQYRMRNGGAVERGGSTAKLIENHERVGSGVVQNRRSLLQLDHERAAAIENVVVGTDARKDAIGRRQRARFGRHEAADLRHDDGDACLAQQRALAAHVGSGQHHCRWCAHFDAQLVDGAVLVHQAQHNVVGNDVAATAAAATRWLEVGMAHLADAQQRLPTVLVPRHEARPTHAEAIAAETGDGQAHDAIELCSARHGALQHGVVAVVAHDALVQQTVGHQSNLLLGTAQCLEVLADRRCRAAHHVLECVDHLKVTWNLVLERLLLLVSCLGSATSSATTSPASDGQRCMRRGTSTQSVFADFDLILALVVADELELQPIR
jgi:hypothetical protein